MEILPDLDARYEFRCPVHGFVELSHWERDVISQPAYQRLRRIRQLAWTDQVYPGAMHTRFEHSLGVMHVATLLYDALSRRSKGFLRTKLGCDEFGIQQDRQLVRFAALLHDVGHSPFSHAGEELMPEKTPGEKFKHEDYSAAVIRGPLRAAIESHPFNQTLRLSADEIAAFIEGKPTNRRAAFWRELVSSQMDADRMDYLLRDSLHIGVQYGRYDLHRLISTACAIEIQDERGSKSYRIGVSEGGWHAAEALVIARYAMFTQVYFHKTRVAYDIHLRRALKDILPGGKFPLPTPSLSDYLSWDDWKVLGSLSQGNGGEHGERLRTRNHYREIHHTSESPELDELANLKALKAKLGDLVVDEESADDRTWYKLGRPDIPVLSDSPEGAVKPLSSHSVVIERLQKAPHRQVRLFALPEKVDEARRITTNFFGNGPAQLRLVEAN